MILIFKPFKSSILDSFTKMILFFVFILISILSKAQTISICEGNTDTLVNASPGGTWSSSAPSICTVDASSGEINAISEGFCTITYTDLTLTTTNYSITVNGMPTINPISGPNSVCLNSNITVTTTSIGGVWSSSDASILSTTNSGVLTGVNPGTATINYTITNGSCEAIESYLITVINLPVVNPITEFADICVGSNFGFVNTTPNGIWSSSDNFIASMDNDGFATGVSYGTVTIKYTVTEQGCSNFSSVSVDVIAPSTLELTSTIVSDSQTVCLSNTIEEISYLLGGSGSNIHIVGGNLPNGVTGTYLNGVYTINGTPLESGVFTINIETYGSLCDYEANELVYIKVDSLPKVDFTYSIDGLNVVFNNTTTNSDLSYSWDFGPGNSILENPTHTFADFGTYTVSLTSQNNCGSSTTSHILGLNGLADLNLMGYKLFPNPFTNELSLKFETAEKTEIIITDLIGKTLYAKEFTQDFISLNLEEFSTGQYLLKVTQNSKTQIEKIVKR